MTKIENIIITIIVLVIVVIVVIVGEHYRKIEELEIKNNPCYSDCIDLKTVNGYRGRLNFEFKYIANGITYKGSAPAGDNEYRKHVQSSNLKVMFLCTDAKRYKLIVPPFK